MPNFKKFNQLPQMKQRIRASEDLEVTLAELETKHAEAVEAYRMAEAKLITKNKKINKTSIRKKLYKGQTMDKIAKEYGISVRTLYRAIGSGSVHRRDSVESFLDSNKDKVLEIVGYKKNPKRSKHGSISQLYSLYLNSMLSLEEESKPIYSRPICYGTFFNKFWLWRKKIEPETV